MEKDSTAEVNSTNTPVAFQTGVLVTSTPFDGERGTSFGSTNKKADVSQLFQNIGSKLGWFDHGDLDMALKKLSKSSKKKTNKSKLEKDIDDSKAKSSKRSTKEKPKKPTKSSSNKENEKKSNQVKSSRRDASPFKVITNDDSLDDFKDIPLKRKPGQINLATRSQKISFNAENNSSSSSSDIQSESPSFDFGRPIKESTRIHSRKSIDNILDATNISEVSTDKSVDSLSNSGDDSYKQLHINQRNSHKKEKTKCSNNDDICIGLQGLDIQEHRTSSKGNNSNNSDKRNDQLYVTALEKSTSDESVSDHTQNSNLKNRTVYLECESIDSLNSSEKTNDKGNKAQYISMSESKSSFNSNSSYFEVNDLSVQASEDAAGFCQTGKRNCSRTSDSSSVVEVNDVSQQTSLPLLSSASEVSLDSNFSFENNKNVSPNLPSENVIENSEEVLDNNLIDSSSSFVQVQDTSTQIDGIDTVSVEVKNDTCDVVASSSTEGKITDKTQYFDFSNSSVKSESTKGSKNSSVNSEISVNSKVNETKYFSDDGDHASYNIDNIDDANVTKSFSDSEQLYNLDQTKYFSGENDDSSKHDRNQDNNVTKSFSDSDQVDSLPEQTQYFSGDNENYRSLNSFDNQECNNSEVSNSSDQQFNIQDKTRYFDFASDKNASSENEFCEENDYLQTGKKSDKQSDQQETKVKCNFVEISSDEEFPFNKDRDKTKKLHKNLLTRENQEKPNTSRQFSDHDLDDSLPDPSVSQNKPKWRKTNGYHSDCSSSDDNLEQFFQKMKTPAKAKKSSSGSSDKHNNSMADFIVNDSDMSSEDEDDDCFYLSTNSKLNLDRKNESIYIIGDDEDGKNTDESDESLFSSSSDSDKDLKKDKPGSFVKPVTKNVGTEKTLSSGEREKSTSREKSIKYSTSIQKPDTTERKYSFLKSLSAGLPENKCDSEALRYIKTFKKTKDELLKKLFKLYNETVFDYKLPKDLEIVWNKRLLQTAGYCTYKRNVRCSTERTVRLEMSVKVCDTAERVRDTLIHELCHAAVWLLNGKSDGHGPYWKYWARKANLVHPELPVIARCHTYQITYKYTYVCSGCGYSIGRHSKSLDTTRKVCGHCRSHFVLKDSNTYSSSDTTANQPKTPRTPNRFAMFVKENYGSVKKIDKNLKHKEIMNVLSKQFAEKNKIS